MKGKIFFLILLWVWAFPGAVSSYGVEQKSSLQWEDLLEKPSWGMIEWSSATLPKGFWYPSFEFLYVSNGSYFSAGKEVDYTGGRDSISYMITGRLLYGVSNKFTLGVYIPVVLEQKVDSGLYEKSTKVKSGVSNVGDIQLFFKYRFVERYFWSLATEAGITLPTGRPYNKVSAKQAGTGDGQTDLSLAVNGDILLTEESFIKLGMRYTYQFKREYRNQEDKLIEEKLGSVLGTNLGFVRNFRNVGMGGALKYTWWQATWNDAVKSPQADLFSFSLHLSLGEPTPRRHGKIDFTLDFPLTGKNAPALYRFGISIKSIFK
ncbi:MAG: hypothetical protein AMJ91_04370 [candidate division Zixibacteria bacterium SM23_73_3]|nr:MAG: hypothetical protein AMJ91_04370 [candidate division Zixibacteria bacterium SM23_73_3]